LFELVFKLGWEQIRRFAATRDRRALGAVPLFAKIRGHYKIAYWISVSVDTVPEAHPEALGGDSVIDMVYHSPNALHLRVVFAERTGKRKG
jgi:hypothetical protein